MIIGEFIHINRNLSGLGTSTIRLVLHILLPLPTKKQTDGAPSVCNQEKEVVLSRFCGTFFPLPELLRWRIHARFRFHGRFFHPLIAPHL